MSTTEQPPRPILSVIIVNYNSWLDVDRLVAALALAPELADGRAEVVVVDNASDGPVSGCLVSPPVGVRLVARVDNGGFAVGVNAGWRACRGSWVLLLNPDVIAGADLPGRVLDRIGHHEGRPDGPPGIIGFGLRNANGARQPSVGFDPGLFRSLGGLFLPRRRRKYQSGSRTTAGPVPWVTGACALVDSSLLDALGGMDEDFFLYYEEVALCRAARQLGRRVEFDPTVEVVHLHPLQNRPITPKLRVITRHSKLLYFRKYLPRWQFEALARIVALEAAVRSIAARRLGHKIEANAWRIVGGIARRMREDDVVRGADVRDLAESLTTSPPGYGRPSFRTRARLRVGRDA